MKRLNLLLALIFCTAAMFMKTDAWAAPHEHGDSHNFGREDSHHVWHDAEYWHARHPDWVYRYHPEWAIEREEWWRADHEYHPEWFAYPFWQEYPVWGWGEYDRYHTWRSWGWWHEHDRGWFYAHHPEWAEGRPDWMREDRGEHPEWFRSAYWREHSHDWNHPDEGFRRAMDRNSDYQKKHPESPGNETHNGYHPEKIASQPGQRAPKLAPLPGHSQAAYHASPPNSHPNPPSPPSHVAVGSKKN